MTKVLQPSLTAGELAPGMWGRVDIARYSIAVKKARNVIVRPTGGQGKRTGTIYRGVAKTGSEASVMIPFIYSTLARYLIECGNLYMRFWYLDANNVLVQIMDGLVPLEIVTPYAVGDLGSVHFTQSADVLYLFHEAYPTKELRRLTTSSFEIRDYVNRFGPFRPLNINEGSVASVSAAIGDVTVTCTDEIFVAGHVGALFYVEEQELRTIKPWEPASKDVAIGEFRRSDGKIYRASAVSTGGTYHVCGGSRPIHDTGRAWDGSGDTRSDGVNNYTVGVEWEYVNSGYGIVKLTGFTNTKTMSGVVVQRVPESCIGTSTPGSTWALTGDGSTKTFAIVDALSPSVRDYLVTEDGAGVPP